MGGGVGRYLEGFTVFRFPQFKVLGILEDLDFLVSDTVLGRLGFGVLWEVSYFFEFGLEGLTCV